MQSENDLHEDRSHASFGQGRSAAVSAYDNMHACIRRARAGFEVIAAQISI